jgi:hypothetical protein
MERLDNFLFHSLLSIKHLQSVFSVGTILANGYQLDADFKYLDN